jgi:predicted HicB family RNase H-like nuclease
MGKSKPRREALPEKFKTAEEFAKFWDTHDTEDYAEAWREVIFVVSKKKRKYPRVVLEPSVERRLVRRARSEGISLNELVNRLLKKTSSHAVK